jgi:hypothetical protein
MLAFWGVQVLAGWSVDHEPVGRLQAGEVYLEV